MNIESCGMRKMSFVKRFGPLSRLAGETTQTDLMGQTGSTVFYVINMTAQAMTVVQRPFL